MTRASVTRPRGDLYTPVKANVNKAGATFTLTEQGFCPAEAALQPAWLSGMTITDAIEAGALGSFALDSRTGRSAGLGSDPLNCSLLAPGLWPRARRALNG
jgi:hypothetical protein